MEAEFVRVPTVESGERGARQEGGDPPPSPIAIAAHDRDGAGGGLPPGGPPGSSAPPPPVAAPSEAARPRPPGRRYVGGFSSSICALFSDPAARRRHDCCAIACCGLLLSDRTRYLLTGERPPSWWRRLGINVLPLLLLIFGLNVALEEDAAPFVVLLLFVLILVYVIVIAVRARMIRASFREALVRTLFVSDAEAAGREVDDAAVAVYTKQHQGRNVLEHMACCCYNLDQVYTIDDPPSDRGGEEASGGEDLCACLWKALSSMCCGCGCCGIWQQCCGMCAIGQEAREVEDMVTRGWGKPSSAQPGGAGLSMDYITFQPWSEYFPQIEALHDVRDGAIAAHWRALSDLSTKLTRVLGGTLLLLGLFSLTNVDKNFTMENMLVLLATFVQAFLIIYFVHWRWHRFDLSLDAVVKYFTSGFLLVSFLAVMFEEVVSLLSNYIFNFVIVTIIIKDLQNPDKQNERYNDPIHYIMDFARAHPGIFILHLFISSFVVAAFVEEMCKYFGYWMVEHPDSAFPGDREAPPRQQGSAELVPLGSDPNPNENDAADGGAMPVSEMGAIGRGKSLKSIGGGITIAMVSVAVGFACCENLIYVFLFSPSSAGAEFSTLLVRSFLPVHPLAAAIQSIGVCQRDLEGDKTCQLGRIVFPAVFLHGCYDFALMTMGFLQAINSDTDETQGSGNESGEGGEDGSIDWKSEMPSLALGVVFVVAGAAYYLFLSTAQKARLRALDDSRRASHPVDSRSLLV